jgi:hypothetical protein
MKIKAYQVAGIASAAATAQAECKMYSVYEIALELLKVHQQARELHALDELKASTGRRLPPHEEEEQRRLQAEITTTLQMLGAKHIVFPGNPLARPVQVEFVPVENPDSHHFTHQFG